MYSSNIYKPLEQFVFSKNQRLNYHFHLQSQGHYCHSLLILPHPMIHHPSESLRPQHFATQVVEVFHQLSCFVWLNLLLFPLLVIFFFLLWKLVAGCIHTRMALTHWFHLLTSQVYKGLPLLCYVLNNAANSMLVN